MPILIDDLIIIGGVSALLFMKKKTVTPPPGSADPSDGGTPTTGSTVVTPTVVTSPSTPTPTLTESGADPAKTSIPDYIGYDYPVVAGIDPRTTSEVIGDRTGEVVLTQNEIKEIQASIALGKNCVTINRIKICKGIGTTQEELAVIYREVWSDFIGNNFSGTDITTAQAIKKAYPQVKVFFDDAEV